MKFLLLFLLMLADESSPKPQFDVDGQRSMYEINLDIKAFFKREAVAKEDGIWMASIRDVCHLYMTIKRDPRLAESPLLQSYKAKVWSRMKRIEKDLNKAKKIRERRQDKKESSKSTEGIPRSAIASPTDLTSQFLAEQMVMMNAASGGPSTIVGFANGSWGGGTVEDYGDDLVRLIQTTIEPDFWDINGGPGTIYYYRPLHALVIRATSTVHEKIGGAVGALRKAGR